MLEALGLEVCQDTSVGTALIRGISNGQKQRLSLGRTRTPPPPDPTPHPLPRSVRQGCICKAHIQRGGPPPLSQSIEMGQCTSLQHND